MKQCPECKSTRITKQWCDKCGAFTGEDYRGYIINTIKRLIIGTVIIILIAGAIENDLLW